jgi:hypothetical protein
LDQKGGIAVVRTFFAIALLGAGFAAGAAQAASAPAQYDVTMRLQDGDGPVTNPRLLVRAGEPATFMVGNASYSLRVMATPQDDGTVRIASEVAVWTPQGLRPDASQRTVRAGGESAALAFTHFDPKTGRPSDLRLSVAVRQAD